jgi:CheY-like chemotaxis protein
MGHEPPFILCAEDDDGTGVLIERDLTHVDPTTSPQRLHDAQEAMDFVRCDETYANRYITKPIVLLLNVNMPRVDGVETLRQLKSDKPNGVRSHHLVDEVRQSVGYPPLL